MDRMVSAFLTQLKSERQASAHTIRSYEHDLDLYCRYVSEALGEEADPRGSIRSGFGGIRPGYRDRGSQRARLPVVWPAYGLSFDTSADRDSSVPTPRPVFATLNKLKGYLDCCA